MVYFKKINCCLTKEVITVKKFLRAVLILIMSSAFPGREEVELADGVHDGIEAIERG